MTRLLLLLLLASPLCAQGVLRGHAFDAAGGSEYLDEAGAIAVITLPETSPPFNELTAGEWQEPFNAILEGREAAAALGAPYTEVLPGATLTAELHGDGGFELNDVPLNHRLAVAVKIGGLWWPLREELLLTEENPGADVQIPYYRLGGDPADVRIASWRLEAGAALRADLRYAPVAVEETITLTNPNPEYAVLVTLELDIMIAPSLSSVSLPAMYGSQLLYMQGWNAAPPLERPFSNAAAAAWTFGTGGGMHGGTPQFGSTPQLSADSWHMLNREPMLAMVGAGDTQYRANNSPSGRSATLIFTRPVPPARDGLHGALTIRVLHKGGILHTAPEGKLAFNRRFGHDVSVADARASTIVTLSALVEDSHRGLYGAPRMEGQAVYPPHAASSPNLAAGQTARIVIGFSPQAQSEMAAFETGVPAPTDQPAAKGPSLDASKIFMALSVVFGLAFLGALVATVRKPRDEQLKRLADLPATRAEVLAAIAELEAEYRDGKLPARVYQEQRQRLLNRLVEFDSREDA